jgi:choline dehydrogenase
VTAIGGRTCADARVTTPPHPDGRHWIQRLAEVDARTGDVSRQTVPRSCHHIEARQDRQDLIDHVRLAHERLVWTAGLESLPGHGTESRTPQMITSRGIEGFLRLASETSYHPSGTCRMGADPDAVVDPTGTVQAVDRLRVVDASIMPRIVTANLNAAVMMMAEKVSDHILGRTPLAPSSIRYYRTPVR